MLSGTKKMGNIKIAFIILYNQNWLGGLNYYKNLIDILLEDDSRCLEPIIFTNNSKINDFFPNNAVKIIKSSILIKYSFLWFLNKISKKIFKREFLLEFLLKKYHIKVLSHSMYMIKNIIQIPWIPDFQHIHLPEFFDKKERISRDLIFKQYAQNGNIVIVSSNDARKDFCKEYPNYKDKAMVLNFVVQVKRPENCHTVLEKYGIKKPFFYLPNQFWQHKNHRIVVEALTYLKDTDIIVYCTGNTDDYRNKSYYNELLKFINENSLNDKFKVLGIVPYNHVQILMEACKAVINPSLFEGWSTTVEEAKSFGKRIILSDIDVHKEQNPEGAIFFNKNCAIDLSNKMLQVWNEPEEINEILKNNASNNLQNRKKEFLESYYNIIKKALSFKS